MEVSRWHELYGMDRLEAANGFMPLACEVMSANGRDCMEASIEWNKEYDACVAAKNR